MLLLLPPMALADSARLRTRLIDGAGGVPLNIVEAGTPGSPAIIFIHGLSQSHLSWEKQLTSALANDFHMIAYDLRGHGNSGKPWNAADYAAPTVWAGDLKQVMIATGVRKPLLVAWSYGSWIAVDYLVTEGPQSIAGLVLIGALGGLAPGNSRSRPGDREKGERIRAGINSGLLRENFAAGAEIIAFFLRGAVGDDRWLRDNAAATALLPPYARPLILQRSFDHSTAIGSITMPTLLLLGSEDPQVTPEDARSLAATLPDADVSIFEGSGHLPFVEDQPRFNSELKTFARQTLNVE